MSNYFTYFPTTQNDINQRGSLTTVTNILRRFKIKDSLKELAGVYYEYVIQEGDRPDTIAHKYYGNSSYAWVVLLFNEIHDPLFDWPLFGKDFEEYIKGKYGSIPAAQTEVHEYRRILSDAKRLYDGTVIHERYVVVDKTTYDTLAPTARRTIYKLDWELEVQEEKRKIKLLDEKYLDKIKVQVEDILKNGL
jgi:hypothetical protein